MCWGSGSVYGVGGEGYDAAGGAAAETERREGGVRAGVRGGGHSDAVVVLTGGLVGVSWWDSLTAINHGTM